MRIGIPCESKPGESLVAATPATAAQLRRMSDGAGLSARVNFAGELAGDALSACYDESDIFVLPTHYEGYGMAVAEALARGIPVVSTPIDEIDIAADIHHEQDVLFMSRPLR